MSTPALDLPAPRVPLLQQIIQTVVDITLRKREASVFALCADLGVFDVASDEFPSDEELKQSREKQLLVDVPARLHPTTSSRYSQEIRQITESVLGPKTTDVLLAIVSKEVTQTTVAKQLGLSDKIVHHEKLKLFGLLEERLRVPA